MPESYRVSEYKLKPEKEHVDYLMSLLRASRQCYNDLLAERIAHWEVEKQKPEEERVHMTAYSQKAKHRGADWRIPSRVYESCIERLDLAYRAFFRGLKTGRRVGKPEFAAAHKWNSVVYSYAPNVIDEMEQLLYLDRGKMRIPVLLYRPIPGPYKSITFVLRPSGWYVQLKTLVTPQELEKTGRVVGVDTGVAYLAVDSDGAITPHPNKLAKSLDRLKDEGRKLSRGKFSTDITLPPTATYCLCCACGKWTDSDPMQRMFTCEHCKTTRRRDRNARANAKRLKVLKVKPDAPKEEVERVYQMRVTGVTVPRTDPAILPPSDPDTKRVPSKRRRRQKMVVGRLHERIAQQRKEALHAISRNYVNEYDGIVMEDLTLRQLLEQGFTDQNRRLADASIAKLRQYVSYKATDGGREYKAIKASGTTRFCSQCGNLTETSYADRELVCGRCGNHEMRQLNSAWNILHLSQIQIPEKTTLEDLAILYTEWLREHPLESMKSE